MYFRGTLTIDLRFSYAVHLITTLWGIGFGWAPIGFAIKSLLQETMSSRRLLLTYSNFVEYSYLEIISRTCDSWYRGTGILHIGIMQVRTCHSESAAFPPQPAP